MHMNNRPRLLAVAFVLAAVWASAHAAAPAPLDAAERSALGNQIVKKWGGFVAKTYKLDAKTWGTEMAPVFSEATLEELSAAASAPDFASMNQVLLGQQPLAKSGGGDGTQVLGEISNDLVFVPITPCRIIDTRLAGGQIAANTVRHFDVTAVSDYAFQGGDASNCNGAGSAGSFAAAAINFVAVTPSAAGYITAYPFLAPQPLASTLNYVAGDIVANFAIVRLDQGASANELSVFSFAQTHLVADLVGYYINPELAPIDCVETFSSNITVNANSTGTGSSPACPAGYTIMSGGCTMSTFDGRIVSSRSFPNSNTHFCAFRNENASASNLGVVYGRCCRLPQGR
jgi:hypothetical protein